LPKPECYPSGKNDPISSTNKTIRQIFDWVKIWGYKFKVIMDFADGRLTAKSGDAVPNQLKKQSCAILLYFKLSPSQGLSEGSS